MAGPSGCRKIRMQSDDKPLCVILGGGGHARVVIDSLLASGAAVPYGVLDVDPARLGSELCGVPILGDDTLLPEVCKQGVTFFAVGVGAVGDNRPRQRVYELGLSAGLKPLTII